MRRILGRACLPLVAACACLPGCANNPPSHSPPDPLLLSRKPIESRPAIAAPALYAQHEPRAPESLDASLADANDKTAEDQQHRLVPATPASLRGGQDDVR